MAELHLPADDFRIGDRVHLADGRVVEIRDIVRGEKGRIICNPGAADQLDGRVWEHATVTREEQL